MMTCKTSVAICGAGPAGLTLAHLLAQAGVDCTVIERLPATLDEPRAIALDGESIRTLQKLGVLEGIQDGFLCGLEAEYVNGVGTRLFKVGRPDYQPYGYSMVNSFDQPALDRHLAVSLVERESARLLFEHTLLSFEQNDKGVRIFCRDGNGDDIVIEASYFVGCDGGRSTVRSLLDIAMEGESNPQPWLVIDTRDAHLDGQLDCRFFCDPKRPGMTIRKRHGERRWEWMLMPGETPEQLLEDAMIRELIAPYTDVQQVDVYRKRVYDFHAIMAERWREGRIFLAGDAAHMTPPFAGQGLNSGLRDVANLAWKLAAVIKGVADNDLLETYEKDRRDHAWELIQTALNLGQQIQPIDPAAAAERDAFFAELNQSPAAMEALEMDMARAVMDRQVDVSLIVANEDFRIPGSLLIQPAVVRNGQRVLLDEVLGTGFALLGINCDPQVLLTPALRAMWDGLGLETASIWGAEASAPGNAWLDEAGAFATWLGDKGQHILLIRPDRFCMAQAAPGEIEVMMKRARALLNGQQQRPAGDAGAGARAG